MTEAELVEAITSYMGIAFSQTTQILGLLFAYVIVAYLAGSKISRSQALVLTVLYVSLFISGLSGTMGAQMRAGVYAQRLKEVRPDDLILLGYENQLFSGALAVLCLSASLWFMWSVRHPKTE